MRVDIRINGESLDIKPRSGFELQMNNPAAGYEAITGVRAVNMQVMNTQRNRQIMGVSQDPRRRAATDLMPTEIYAGGNLIDSGACYLRDLSSGLDVDYTSGLAEFFGVYQKMKLSEFTELGTLEVPSTWNSTVGNTWLTGGYVLPTVQDPAFFKEAPAGWDERVNSYAGSYIVSSPKVPMFFLKNILKKVGDLAGVKYSGPFWEDAGSLIIFNTVRAGVTEIDIRRHLPDLTIAELLLSLRKALNLSLAFDNRSRTLRLDYSDQLRRQPPTQDWTDRMPRFKGGKPLKYGAVLFEYGGDSNDNTAKDAFFSPFTLQYGNGETWKMSGSMMPLMMKSSLPYTETPEREEGKEQRVLRLLNWNGNPLTASNQFNGAEMTYSGLLDGYWQKTVNIEAESYIVETPAALTAVDVAWLADSFSGSGQAPVIYSQGVNWEVLQAIVSFGDSRISRIKIRRL